MGILSQSIFSGRGRVEEPRIAVEELAAWLRGLGYRIEGPDNDRRELIVTIDHLGNVELSLPAIN